MPYLYQLLKHAQAGMQQTGMKRISGLSGVAVRLVVSVPLITLSCLLHAQQIYKTIDADGNVSYSGEPPKAGQQVEVIEALPEPDPADTEAAVQRQQKIEETIEQLEQEQIEQEQREYESSAGRTTVVVNTTPLIVPTHYFPRHRHKHRHHTVRPRVHGFHTVSVQP